MRREGAANSLRIQRDQLLRTLPDRRKTAGRPRPVAPDAGRLATDAGRARVAYNQKMLKRLLLAFFLALPAFCQPANLDDYILHAMQTFEVPGVGVAVVKDGQV